MKNHFMQESDQLNEIDKDTEKARDQIEKERKGDNQDYIAEWFRWVELTGKYLKNKLN